MTANDPFLREVASVEPMSGSVLAAASIRRSWLEDGDAVFEVDLVDAGVAMASPVPMTPPPVERTARLRLRACGQKVLRMRWDIEGGQFADSPMLDMDASVAPQALHIEIGANGGQDVVDSSGVVRARFLPPPPAQPIWSRQLPQSAPALAAVFYPDGRTAVPLTTHDCFFPGEFGSLGLGLVMDNGAPRRALFSLHAEAGERFAGTGERFAKLDLAGRTIRLENADALGINNTRAYKNVPFYLSSAGYGLLLHTSAHAVLSLAHISTRAAQGAVEEPFLDVFFFGGGPEPVLRGLRAVSGFPACPPRWSYGVWMSKMSYFSEEEVRSVAARLRAEDYPCDVLHLDTGWFAKDWVCEWRFSPERFPDPERFFREMRGQGFRVSLWQNPNLGEGNSLLEEARRRGFVPTDAADKTASVSASDFSGPAPQSQIDFTHPGAVEWYRGMIRRLLQMGAAAIKTDFGEVIRMDVAYHGMDAARLHNLYCVLYQSAAFAETRAITGDSIIWARAGWTGCQRYPVHWGGDCAATWDGMAASLRGGLHLGLSGFAHWSHDVPGFHGLPDFMNDRASDELAVRWTQFGVLSSHLRYHGTSDREPYSHPTVAPLLRSWLRLRYALIPYLELCAKEAASSGFPVLRAMPFADPEDPVCWMLDDQYLLGGSLLVAPLLRPGGVRDVYLPRGTWMDFWTGQCQEGPAWLKAVNQPLSRCPLYARTGATLAVHPHPVRHTGEMDSARDGAVVFDESYRGLTGSILSWIRL